ncbi:MAG: hypothetical protein US28_C0047G0011 [Candidatus Daviesbacteria bacterium GW2011_GWA1_36_8]|uniref:Uncharacterized protein n=1 Tax=Candidatus Daviesbacteria bacterium GW2011_GWA1_36_8 TaxID=1618417 RepID=A0A0G0FJ24_9BACT|nr:MAG: hypothetical protein US28_C0047G0011 [Candidatus Daviesbacteria bacterium GW2011_GWA1_36_8]
MNVANVQMYLAPSIVPIIAGAAIFYLDGDITESINAPIDIPIKINVAVLPSHEFPTMSF